MTTTWIGDHGTLNRRERVAGLSMEWTDKRCLLQRDYGMRVPATLLPTYRSPTFVLRADELHC
jgi:hypothetical protein